MRSKNDNRHFRFQFDPYVTSEIEPSGETKEKTVTLKMKDFSVHLPKEQQQNQATLSPQDQKRLSVLAKQAKENGGNGGLSTEYLERIPAKQHNMITMQSAGDKLKEMKEEMNEEIKNNSGDVATSDILSDAANDHILYKDYDMEVLDQYMTKIESMSLLECISLKNSVAKELNRLESCHTMLKAVDDLRENFDFVAPGKEITTMDRKNAGTDVDKQIMSANYLDQYGFTENADEFTKLYDAYQPKLKELTEKLAAHISECGKDAASTTYMTNDFLHIIDKRLNNMKSDEMNYEYTSARLETLRNAFSNRTDISYLKNKLRLFTNNKTHMKGLAKALNGTFSGIAAKLNKNFSPITLREFVNCMEDCFENDQIKIISLLYFLNYVCTSEAKTNNDVWVKVFMLNISDIRKGIWDLDIHWSTYLKETCDTLDDYLSDIKDYLTKRKVKINPQILAQYEKVMNYVPEEKKEDEESSTEDTSESTEISDNTEKVEVEEVGVGPITTGEVVDVEVTE